MGGAIGAGRTQLSGYVDIDNCIFESNKANGATFINCNGGAIYCLGYVVIKNCTLKIIMHMIMVVQYMRSTFL